MLLNPGVGYTGVGMLCFESIVSLNNCFSYFSSVWSLSTVLQIFWSFLTFPLQHLAIYSWTQKLNPLTHNICTKWVRTELCQHSLSSEIIKLAGLLLDSRIISFSFGHLCFFLVAHLHTFTSAGVYIGVRRGKSDKRFGNAALIPEEHMLSIRTANFIHMLTVELVQYKLSGKYNNRFHHIFSRW